MTPLKAKLFKEIHVMPTFNIYRHSLSCVWLVTMSKELESNIFSTLDSQRTET